MTIHEPNTLRWLHASGEAPEVEAPGPATSTSGRKSVRVEDIGKNVRLYDAINLETYAQGRVVDYTEAPSITVETAAGERVSWRADLAEVEEQKP